MPKRYTTRQVVRVLEGLGFVFVGRKSTHLKYFHPKKGRVVIVPQVKKEIEKGTLGSILRQARVEKEVFEKLVH